MYPDKNMLEQLKNLSVYAKQLKEISSFLQQTPNFYEYDEISSNPNEAGKETFVSYKTFVIFFMCVVLTILDVAPIPYANLIKSLTEAFIAKYKDDENIKSYLDKFYKATIDFLEKKISFCCVLN